MIEAAGFHGAAGGRDLLRDELVEAPRRRGARHLRRALPDRLLKGASMTRSNRRRYALVGTGNRGTTMWGSELLAGWSDEVDLVAIVDTNPLRAERARAMMGANAADAPVSTDLDAMLAERAPRPRHRLHARRHPRRHHRPRARGRLRRRHRKADDDHGREDPPHPRRREAHRPTRRRHVQLPLRADRGAHQGAARRRRDRRACSRSTSTGISTPGTAPTTSAAGTPTSAIRAACSCTRPPTTSTC